MNKLKKETNKTVIKRARNLFRLKKKENKAIKQKIVRDIRNLFEYEEEYYYNPVGKFWSNNYTEYKSKDDRKTLSVKKLS